MLSKHIIFRSRPPQHEYSDTSRDDDPTGGTSGDQERQIQ